MYRKLSLALLAAVSALTVAGSLSPAAAEPIQDAYCLQGRSHGYPGDCAYSSYQQCAATASGTGETCGINPMRAYPQPRRGAYYDRY